MSATVLESPLEEVVGARTATGLRKSFGFETVRDLLWHFPRRYSHRGELTPLTGLPVGEHVTVLAQVLDARERSMQRGGSLLEVRLTDGTGILQLTFFNQRWRAAQLLPRVRGIFSGKVSEYRGNVQLQHPDYELFADRDAAPEGAASAADPHLALTPDRAAGLDEAAARAWSEQPVPMYPASAKMPSWVIEKAVGVALDAVHAAGGVSDPLPPAVRRDGPSLELGQALEQIHRPIRTADWREARASMLFREAFDLQLGLLDRRRRLGSAASTARPAVTGGVLDQFDATLPFTLTAGQREAGTLIAHELAQPHPMHRLLQGEVGSGKTLVALRAMLQVAEGDGQSAMLAPTEVLAGQHSRSVLDALGPELVQRLRPVVLTSKMPVAQRRSALLAIASGASRIVVGTHALISEHVSFYDLGLVVVDEQHRFGVEQRDALRQKGTHPHTLAMTATPIPRTVALTAFGDLETSTIRDLPPGRQGISTFAVSITEKPHWEERAWVRATEEVAAGRQVYVVCPAISAKAREEGAEAADATDATPAAPTAPGKGNQAAAASAAAASRPMSNVVDTVAQLQARPDFQSIRVAALTGAMKADEKDRVMREFAAGDIDVLVATTVIEVGVNVPNASTMIVRDADRFGISQLHQLRGRVGRGEHPGLCLLLTAALSGTTARERIDAVAGTTDGFVLADIDLDLRREGDILGTAQSGGKSTLRLLRVAEHGELIVHARDVAGTLLQHDPELRSAPELAQQLRREAELQSLDNLAKS